MNQATEIQDMALTLITPGKAYVLRAIPVSGDDCTDKLCPIQLTKHTHAVGPDGRPYAVSA